MSEALTATLTVCLTVAGQLFLKWRDARARRAGRLRTRSGDWDPGTHRRGAVWIGDDHQAGAQETNGHGDLDR